MAASTARKLKTKSGKGKTLVRKKTKLPIRKKTKSKSKAKAKTKLKAKAKSKTKAKSKKTSATIRTSATKATTRSTSTVRKLKTVAPIATAAVAATAAGAGAAAAISSSSSTPRIPENRVGPGDMAPDFSLPDQTGNTVNLSDLRGKKVVLYFYPKDDTPGCTKESCSFRDNRPNFDGADAEIIGVSFDNGDSHQKFIQKYDLNFKLLSDENKEVAQKYGVYVQKNMYGNISWGIERSTFVIDREGKITNAWRRVNVDGHTDEVLEAVRAIQ